MTVVMIGLFGLVPGGFVPEEDEGYFLVNVQLPDAASLERTDEVVAAKSRTDSRRRSRVSSIVTASPATV